MQVHSYHPRKEKKDHFQPPVGFTVRHLPLSQTVADEVARATKIDCTEENGVAMKDIYTILLNETSQSKVVTTTADKMPTAVVKKVRAWKAILGADTTRYHNASAVHTGIVPGC